MSSWLAWYILVSSINDSYYLSHSKIIKNYLVKNLVPMDIGVKNVKKFARVPRMDPNAITCPVNANAVLVIMVITVMNYVPLVLLEAAAQKYAFVESVRMTVTRSMDVAYVSLVTLDLCATKVKILLNHIWR